MFTDPIFYLRKKDFNDNGSLKSNFFKDKLLIIFIHADYCIYCQLAKDAYQAAAIENKNPNILFGAIQADGDVNGESECSEFFNKMINTFQGFPDYAVFKNKNPVHITFEKRSKEYILETLNRI